jgi:hypothetical protein
MLVNGFLTIQESFKLVKKLSITQFFWWGLLTSIGKLRILGEPYGEKAAISDLSEEILAGFAILLHILSFNNDHHYPPNHNDTFLK